MMHIPSASISRHVTGTRAFVVVNNLQYYVIVLDKNIQVSLWHCTIRPLSLLAPFSHSYLVIETV